MNLNVHGNVVIMYTDEKKYDEALQVLEERQLFLSEKAPDEYERNLNKHMGEYYEFKSSIFMGKKELDQAEEAISLGLDFHPSSKKLVSNWLTIIWHLDFERLTVRDWFYINFDKALY